jgi:hypothetical protein
MNQKNPQDDAEKLQALLHPKDLILRRQVIGASSIVPPEPGVYALYFKRSPSPDIQLEKCHKWQGRYLLYVGTSPSKPSSQANLRKRLSGHMRGNASRSTVRKSVGCLMSRALNIQLYPVGSRLTFASGEQNLSHWLEENVSVHWVVHLAPWDLEKFAIATLNLPLNLAHNKKHPFYSTLKKSRKEASMLARSLVV